MVSILINIIQHEEYYLIILLVGRKTTTLLKKRLWDRRSPVNFVQLLGTTFLIENTRATAFAFGLSFVNPRKKYMEELV